MKTRSTPSSESSLLAEYKRRFSLKVKWGDMDAMQHVNNSRYFYYCESARLDFLSVLFPELNEFDPAKLDQGIALAYADCKFKVPVTYPDQIVIGTAVTEIKENEFSVKHAIYSTKHDLIAAESSARLVYYDFKSSKRVAISEAMRDSLQAFSLGK